MTATPNAAPSNAPTILLVGATSGIAAAIARRLVADARDAGQTCNLILAGRDMAELRRLAADVGVRQGGGSGVVILAFDALDFDALPAFFAAAVDRLPGGLTGVVLCHGLLTEQAEAQFDPAVGRRVIDVNFTSAALLLDLAATYFERRAASDKIAGIRPFLCALSSVAGDRGRQSNYTYGAAKAGLTAYLQGLRNRLHRSGVAVVTIKPGFTDTGMTWGVINPKSPLTASPERVAAAICTAIRKRRGEVYTPVFWWVIMTIIRSIPETVFKRLKL